MWKKFLSSKIGIVLAIIHALFLVLVFATSSSHNNLLETLNFFSLFDPLALLIIFLFQKFYSDALLVCAIFIFGTVQWFLVGAFIEKTFKKES